jgi:hypothetical protein
LNRRRGRPHSWSGHFEEEKSIFSLLVIELADVQVVAQSLYCVHYLQVAEIVNLNQLHAICMCSVVRYCKHLAPDITSKFNTFIFFLPCIVKDLKILVVPTNAQFYFYVFHSELAPTCFGLTAIIRLLKKPLLHQICICSVMTDCNHHASSMY